MLINFRLYYGSGERRWLASPSMKSEGDDNGPPSPWVPRGSPPPEQSSQVIRNPRRRPREAQNDGPRAILVDTTSAGIGDIRRGPKKKTSSVWSPHLGPDNRSSPYSMWQPPSATWSTENRIFGRRNIQVVLFVLGFIFPFGKPRPRLFDMGPKIANSLNYNSLDNRCLVTFTTKPSTRYGRARQEHRSISDAR